MLNRYPIWIYITLLVIVVICSLYTLPNLYGKKPAIQITGTNDVIADKQILTQIKNIFSKQKITVRSISLQKSIITITFDSIDTQLSAKELLTDILDSKFTISPNLIPIMPSWLDTLHAKPIKLGFDLQGGVHFLMQANISTALNNLYKQNIDILYHDLDNHGIRYTIINKQHFNCIIIVFPDGKTRNQAINLLINHYNHIFHISPYKNNKLYITINSSYLSKLRKYIIEQNINILRNRINYLGVTEPLVQSQGYNSIIVDLPGIQNILYAKKILGSTATLEFHLVNTIHINYNTTHLSTIPNDSEIYYTNEGIPVILYKHIILTGDHIIHAMSNQDEYGRPQINVILDSIGGDIMSNVTKNNIGKFIATLLIEYKDYGIKDNKGHPVLTKEAKIINIANIQSRINNNFRITGINSVSEAHQLASLLRTGVLVAPINIIEERIIGPTLGAQRIKQGLEACLASLAISMIFMVCLYKKFGIIATIALIINLILIVGIMSLLPELTLTMSGIAGIILTIAFAVDATVLINERIKEELVKGNSIQRAIYKGYHRAFSSIFDANITILIKSFILYMIGTSAVKGFAITTGIGVITSILTSVIGTKAIMSLLYSNSKYISQLSTE